MDDRYSRNVLTNLFVIGLMVAVGGVACNPALPEEAVKAPPKTIVFVHGAWGGGWQFHKVQPLLTFTESIVIENPDAATIPATFIHTIEAGKNNDDFDLFADRARHRGWTVVEMEGSHNPQWYQPENLADLLLQVIQN